MAIPADSRLLDPVIIAEAVRRAQAKRQAAADTSWERSVGLASLLASARGHVVQVETEYASDGDDPPLKGETYYYAKPNEPYTHAMQKLLDEARAYDRARREGTP